MNDNWLFVGAAFVITWGALIGYFIYLQRTVRDARAQLESNSIGGAR